MKNGDANTSYSGCLLLDSYDICEVYDVICNTYSIPQNEGDVQLMSSGTMEESESNNTYSLADTIYDDYDVYGYISSTSDIDYFKIKFSTAG